MVNEKSHYSTFLLGMVLFLIFCVYPENISFAQGREVSCIPRAEMGETTTGEHLYERDDDLKISNLSRIDFTNLTITSAEGRKSEITKVAKNVYKSLGGGTPFTYYFITNDTNSIVTELTIDEFSTYMKVLLCK